jgi:hypothetical protein
MARRDFPRLDYPRAHRRIETRRPLNAEWLLWVNSGQANQRESRHLSAVTPIADKDVLGWNVR